MTITMALGANTPRKIRAVDIPDGTFFTGLVQLKPNQSDPFASEPYGGVFFKIHKSMVMFEQLIPHAGIRQWPLDDEVVIKNYLPRIVDLKVRP